MGTSFLWVIEKNYLYSSKLFYLLIVGLFSCVNNSAAFFHGQVEQPVRGLMSLVNHKDISVLIAINERGVFIIDHHESVRETLIFNDFQLIFDFFCFFICV